MLVVEVEIDDGTLTKAIEAIKQTVRLGRHVKPLQKGQNEHGTGVSI
jgi:hypothetical protein